MHRQGATRPSPRAGLYAEKGLCILSFLLFVCFHFAVCVLYWVGALSEGMLPVNTAGSPGEWPAVALPAIGVEILFVFVSFPF